VFYLSENESTSISVLGRFSISPTLGKAAEITGYSEKAFVEILIHKNVPPIKYLKLDLDKELKTA